jgi:hypothetical protein
MIAASWWHSVGRNAEGFRCTGKPRDHPYERQMAAKQLSRFINPNVLLRGEVDGLCDEDGGKGSDSPTVGWR